ncbi:unnamed protein product [Albugo candida]|uniref:Deacetylase sirtuin-type domain-containing protein n=1 Tax=Albugo candida TaxID=65357 RepID=A0A024GP94_9STRA|nr:unnamed protein product [Albugo candida]|eukprot:CCI48545.1 unnamed protein product [Albugo candida]
MRQTFCFSRLERAFPLIRDFRQVGTEEAYRKLGVDYQDLCDPYWLREDPELFYGFWGHSVNLYRQAEPHDGYHILKKWSERLRAKKSLSVKTDQTGAIEGQTMKKSSSEAIICKPFFIYTSNVDAHFHRMFDETDIYEIHGNVETWQCSGNARSSRNVCPQLHALPKSIQFDINRETMLADITDITDRLQCGCQQRLRPNVLMFHDHQWIPNHLAEKNYIQWEAAVEEHLKANPMSRFVIVEIGCGTRIPSVRKESEVVVSDIFLKCEKRRQVQLVRINPEFPNSDNAIIKENDLLISIQNNACASLQLIDELIDAIN